MNTTTLPTISRSETTELRLTAEQLAQKTSPTTGGRVAVLEAGGLGEPVRLAIGDVAANRIVVGYEAAGAWFERSWVFAGCTDTSNFYRLAGDSSSAGYVSVS